MKYAKAMKLGGELVSADECNYDDFKRLVPLCPECSEPVFLRKGSDRVSTKGKKFKIPQHWSHFDSVSEEQKASCEARVSAYTEKDRQRIASKARGQRLKWLQRWCFSVFRKYSLAIEKEDFSLPFPDSSIWALASGFSKMINRMSDEDVYEVCLKAREDLYLFWNDNENLPHSYVLDVCHESLHEAKSRSRIVSEVLRFMSSKRSSSLVECLIRSAVSREPSSFLEEESFDKAMKRAGILCIYYLSSISWHREFCE